MAEQAAASQWVTRLLTRASAGLVIAQASPRPPCTALFWLRRPKSSPMGTRAQTRPGSAAPVSRKRPGEGITTPCRRTRCSCGTPAETAAPNKAVPQARPPCRWAVMGAPAALMTSLPEGVPSRLL